jgi:hypothetical protein
MVSLEILCGSTVLAAPPVTLEHAAAELAIFFRLKP